MVSLRIVCLFLVVHAGLLKEILGQNDDCVPAAVDAMQLFSNSTLTWQVDPNEPCEITHFLVDIVGDQEDKYYFQTSGNTVDLSFLKICEEWRFSVTPISHDVLGYTRTLTEYVPLPPDADLSLSYFSITSLGERDVLLQWDLENHTHGDCSLHYRLSVEDEELGIAQDVYVQGSSLHLSFLSPCVPYQLGIRAVNRAHPNVEGPIRRAELTIAPKPQVAPALQITDIQATAVSMTWTPEGGSNRCPVRALYVDASNHFNISFSVQHSLHPVPVPIDLKSLRPNSMYYLRVYVENSGGVSTATQLGIQTLDLSPD